MPRSSARAYEVKEGDYIQIVDLFGRQCSDFHCFNARALQKGIERDLDNTVTRTLLGRGYPGPGLFAKVFDQDFQPLVELVQDTCGRHDNFALACTSKYYEDTGLSRPRQLLGQFQRRAGALRRQAAARLGGAQSLLQHRHRPQ